jgi:oxygen-independent coproporphyrinogen-3 oxidase
MATGAEAAPPSAGLYLHFPFCLRKCSYCDFNSRCGSPAERDAYIHALRHEVSRAGHEWGDLTFDTVYFGGGTPTLHSPQVLADIYGHVRLCLPVVKDAEVTVEANPKTVDATGLRYLRSSGFNRVSIGIQSLEDEDLRFLGRMHSAREALAAFHAAREAGFRNINVDLIRGLPRHTPDLWQGVVQRVAALGPEHVSCYGLTLEPGTRLRQLYDRGEFAMPDEDTALDLLRVTDETLTAAGLYRYEVSNWAGPGREACHNIKYWLGAPYLGLGAGAWSFVGGRRWANVSDVAAYITRVYGIGSPVDECEVLDEGSRVAERAMVALRLVGGVPWAYLADGASEEATGRLRDVMAGLAEDGLVWFNNGHVGPTERGLALLNQVGLKLLEALAPA